MRLLAAVAAILAVNGVGALAQPGLPKSQQCARNVHLLTAGKERRHHGQ